jgi:hypothetical protein
VWFRFLRLFLPSFFVPSAKSSSELAVANARSRKSMSRRKRFCFAMKFARVAVVIPLFAFFPQEARFPITD